MRFGACLLSLVLLGAAGCEPPASRTPAAGNPAAGPPPPPGAAVASGASPVGVVTAEAPPPGSKKLTGYFTQDEIERLLREELKAVSVSIRPTGRHAYGGTVETASGEILTLRIKLVDGGIKWWHTNGRGGSGSYAWGNPVPDDGVN